MFALSASARRVLSGRIQSPARLAAAVWRHSGSVVFAHPQSQWQKPHNITMELLSVLSTPSHDSATPVATLVRTALLGNLHEADVLQTSGDDLSRPLEKIPDALNKPEAQSLVAMDADLLLALFTIIKPWREPLDASKVRYMQSLQGLLVDIVGSDHYTLPLRHVAQCIDALAVVGPATCSKETPRMYVELAKAITRSSNFATEVLDSSHFKMIFLNGMRNLDGSMPGSVEMVVALTETLVTRRWGVLTEEHLAAGAYGLHGMLRGRREARRLLYLLSRDIDKRNSSDIKFSGEQLGRLLYGLNDMDAGSKEAQGILSIANRALRHPLGVNMTERDVCSALYGMKEMSSGSAMVRSIMQIVSQKAKACSEAFSAQSVSMALLGLKNKELSDPSTKSLMVLLTRQVHNCALGSFDIRRLAGCFMGLKTMQSDSIEVRALLKALTRHLKIVDGSDTGARPLCNIMYSMNKMDSSVLEVRQVLVEVSRLLIASPSEFRAQGISNAIYGLRHMSSEHKEVRDLVMALVPRIEACDDNIWDIEIAGALLGMQRLNSGCGAVLKLVSAMDSLISRHHFIRPWEGSHISNCLYGLMRMSSRSGQVRRLLRTLLKYFSRSDVPMTSYQVGRALYGLRWMEGDCREVRILLTMLTIKWTSGSDEFTPEIATNFIVGTARLAGNYAEYMRFIRLVQGRIAASSSLKFSQRAINEITASLLTKRQEGKEIKKYQCTGPFMDIHEQIVRDVTAAAENEACK